MNTTPANPAVAAIDVGTNTALCLVARARADGSLETLGEWCLTPRLGAGLIANGTLDPRSSERALAALREFAAHIGAHGIPNSRVRAVGTACLRRALDGRAFARRVARETGIALEVIDELEEARLGEVAIASAGAGPEAVVVDVGGGSSEVACRELGLRISLPIGAVLLTESAASAGQDARAVWERMHAEAQHATSTIRAGIASARAVWAIGGTAVNLGACAARLAEFDPRAVEGVRVGALDVAAWAERLALCSREERLAWPIEPERADILPAGLALLSAILVRLEAREVRICTLGLRHALACELLAR